MKESKTYNAGQLIRDVLEVSGQSDIIPDVDVDKVLFSLGFPNERTTLNIEW